MFICENCNIEHDGSYATGRFCSNKCSRSFSTKNKRHEINKKVSKKLKGNEKCAGNKNKQFICNISYCLVCGKTIKGKNRICSDDCRSAHYSKINKKAYINGNNYIAGGTTPWYNYKNIKVQGTYELRTCSILDTGKNLGYINDGEYTKDRISYIGVDNKKHAYLIDFKVFRHDGSWYYIETKGHLKENDELKGEAVRKCGFELFIWFKKDIINEELKINGLLA